MKHRLETCTPWTCDFCTAGCTFEAMEWCAKRRNVDAPCGYERDQPLAAHQDGTASSEGTFEFVVLKKKTRFQGKVYRTLAEHVLSTRSIPLTDKQRQIEEYHNRLEVSQ